MMGTEITKVEPNALALAAYRGELTYGQTPAPEVAEDDLLRAIAEVDGWLVPLKARDRRFDMIDPAAILSAIKDTPETRQMVEAVKMIGRKLRPDFSESQAGHWTAALVASLTDLPPHVATQACKAALHIPFEFPGQVEKGIREKAVEIEARYKLARTRLASVLRGLRAARDAPPQLPAPEPLTDEQLQEMPDHMRSLGLAAGWLREVTGEDGTPRVEWNPETPPV